MAKKFYKYYQYTTPSVAPESSILDEKSSVFPTSTVTPIIELVKVGNIRGDIFYRIVCTEALGSSNSIRREIYDALCSSNYKTPEDVMTAIDAVNQYINRFSLSIIDESNKRCTCGWSSDNRETDSEIFGTIEDAKEFCVCIPTFMQERYIFSEECHIRDLNKLKTKYEKVLKNTEAKLELINELISKVEKNTEKIKSNFSM